MPAGARLLRWIGLVELVAAVAAFLAVIAVVAWNVTLRYVFNSSLIWFEEVSLLCLNVAVFLGASVLHKAQADVAISVVVDRLPAAARRGAAAATHAAALAFFAVLAAQCIALWPIQRSSTTLMIEIGRYWYTLPMLAASASSAVTSAWYLWRTLAGASALPVIRLPDYDQ